ncbi:cytochrome C oxidase subunit IV family protein [Sulfuricystis multivorans]|uniref:cytochrome C oxidase subunit IV family protein n=1 Tax=Sulfuricystis multivorans TaxID=2211108 RepID=UPI000F8477C1|nr:cytochrome C oxidase subunit IV family protein [Sulfuricystis multivorans]
MNTHLLNVLWVALLVATVLTWLIGKTAHAGPAAVSAILVIAALKGWMIIQDFMGLRRVKLLWRGLVLGWLLVTLAVILIAYWLGLK